MRPLRTAAVGAVAAALVVAATACDGSATGGDTEVLGVTVTSSTTSTEAPISGYGGTTTTAAAAVTTTTTVAAAAGTTTTTTVPAPSTGTVEVAYQPTREGSEIEVRLETGDQATVATRDASGTGRATFEQVVPGRYVISVHERGPAVDDGDTTTSSAVSVVSGPFDVAAGATVTVTCADECRLS